MRIKGIRLESEIHEFEKKEKDLQERVYAVKEIHEKEIETLKEELRRFKRNYEEREFENEIVLRTAQSTRKSSAAPQVVLNNY
jgi:predicted  nucleic acid-binding Zn-ribbon protein